MWLLHYFPNQSPSTRTAHPADAFACRNLLPNQSADLKGILRMFAHSLSEMVTIPRVGMPRFGGDPLHFCKFNQGFGDYLAKYGQDSQFQLMARIECYVDESKEVIKPCAAIMPPEEGLRKAKFLLWRQYGQRHIVVNTNLCKLAGPLLKGKERELRELAYAMMCCEISLKAWGYESSLNSHDLITTVLKRLPNYMQFEFHRASQRQFRNNQDVTFEDLTSFLQKKSS